MNEYSREYLLSFASRRISSSEVVEFLADLFCRRGLPEYIRLRQWQRVYCQKGKEVY